MPYVAGTCRGCGGEPTPGRTRCEACLTDHRDEQDARVDARRAAGQCVRCGEPAGLTRHGLPAKHCAQHLRYYAARQGY